MIALKICKNCGRQTEDGKIRCPYCGYLFEEDMDKILAEMKNNLGTYKSEMEKPAPAPAAPAVPAQSAEGAAYAQSTPQGAAYGAAYAPQGAYGQDKSDKERFELLTEVAQLKGELRALHGEIDRMNAAQARPVQQQQTYSQNYAAPQPVVYAYAPAAQQGVYSQYARPAEVPAGSSKALGKPRSKNRIVLAVLCLLLAGLSIGLFFMDWINKLTVSGLTLKDIFTGYDGVLYIFDKDNTDVLGFAFALEYIDQFDFKGADWVAKACRAFCRYTVEYGVIVYAGLLVLSVLFLLFSLGGKIQLRGWHRFFAWMSFIVSAILFGVFCWIFGFKQISVWFMVSAGANFLRAIFLAFYRKNNKFAEAGLR